MTEASSSPQTSPAGHKTLALKAMGTLAMAAIAAIAIWQLYGRALWVDYHRWREDVRDSEDSVPIGYVGIHYRRSYNDRPLAFHFVKEGRKALWAAKGDAGQPPEFYDVTDAEFAVKEVDGGFGRDSIPGIDHPLLEPPDGPHARFLRDRQMTFGLALEAGPRAYPEDLLEKIEVVNDSDDTTPFVIIFDRGRRRAFAFGRTTGRGVLTFGTTGYSLHNSPLLYDRKTKSLWLLTGEDFACVSGAMKGTRLNRFKEAARESWPEWHSRHPDTLVLVGSDRDKPIPGE